MSNVQKAYIAVLKLKKIHINGKELLGQQKTKKQNINVKKTFGQQKFNKQNISVSLDKICVSIFYCFSA
jgi:hypothetical protein